MHSSHSDMTFFAFAPLYPSKTAVRTAQQDFVRSFALNIPSKRCVLYLQLRLLKKPMKIQKLQYKYFCMEYSKQKMRLQELNADAKHWPEHTKFVLDVRVADKGSSVWFVHKLQMTDTRLHIHVHYMLCEDTVLFSRYLSPNPAPRNWLFSMEKRLRISSWSDECAFNNIYLVRTFFPLILLLLTFFLVRQICLLSRVWYLRSTFRTLWTRVPNTLLHQSASL